MIDNKLKEQIEVLSVTNAEGVTELGDESLSEFNPELDEYVYIKDTGERPIREDYRHIPSNNSDDDHSPGIKIKAPKVIPWPFVGSMALMLFTLIFNAFMIYTYQSNFNQRVTDRLDRIQGEVADIKENTYSKKEQELRIQNQKLQIDRLEHFIYLIKEDVEALEGKNKSSSLPSRFSSSITVGEE